MKINFQLSPDSSLLLAQACRQLNLTPESLIEELITQLLRSPNSTKSLSSLIGARLKTTESLPKPQSCRKNFSASAQPSNRMQTWQYLPWNDMLWPIVCIVLLFLLAVVIKVTLMYQDPVYRDRILYRKDKGKK